MPAARQTAEEGEVNGSGRRWMVAMLFCSWVMWGADLPHLWWCWHLLVDYDTFSIIKLISKCFILVHELVLNKLFVEELLENVLSWAPFSFSRLGTMLCWIKIFVIMPSLQCFFFFGVWCVGMYMRDHVWVWAHMCYDVYMSEDNSGVSLFFLPCLRQSPTLAQHTLYPLSRLPNPFLHL